MKERTELRRYEKELLVRAQEVQLEDRHDRLQQELRERLADDGKHFHLLISLGLYWAMYIKKCFTFSLRNIFGDIKKDIYILQMIKRPVQMSRRKERY